MPRVWRQLPSSFSKHPSRHATIILHDRGFQRIDEDCIQLLRTRHRARACSCRCFRARSDRTRKYRSGRIDLEWSAPRLRLPVCCDCRRLAPPLRGCRSCCEWRSQGFVRRGGLHPGLLSQHPYGMLSFAPSKKRGSEKCLLLARPGANVPTPRSRTWPNSAAGPRRSRGGRRCNTQAVAAGQFR